MRERLVAALVGSTLLVLVLFGVPRAYQVGELVQAQELREVERSADLAAVVVREKVADDQPVTPELLDDLTHEQEHLEYVAADGARVASTATEGTDDPENLQVSRELPDGGTVTLEQSAGMMADRVSDALLPLVLVVLTLLVLSVAIGLVLARLLSRPFQQLAVAARELGTGEPVVDVPRSKIPEAEEIGEAIRTSAVRLEELRQHERELAAHASHELRTPVTALRLELEDLALWPQTAPEVAAQLQVAVAELDRLSSAVSDLLDRSRDQRRLAAQDVDLDELVAAVVVALGRDRGAARRGTGDRARVHHEPGGAGTVCVDRVTLRLLVVTLLEHTLEATGGTVRVETVGAGPMAEIRVRGGDGGPGAPGALGALGATLSRVAGTQELARALGGQLGPLGDGGDGVVVRLQRNIGHTLTL